MISARRSGQNLRAFCCAWAGSQNITAGVAVPPEGLRRLRQVTVQLFLFAMRRVRANITGEGRPLRNSRPEFFASKSRGRSSTRPAADSLAPKIGWSFNAMKAASRRRKPEGSGSSVSPRHTASNGSRLVTGRPGRGMLLRMSIRLGPRGAIGRILAAACMLPHSRICRRTAFVLASGCIEARASTRCPSFRIQ